MKKIITYLAALSLIIAAVPAASMQAAAAETTAAVTAEAEAQPSDLEGYWFYKAYDQEAEDYVTIGYVTVHEDGSFDYYDHVNKTAVGGYIVTDKEEYSNGTTNTWYLFKEDSGELWTSFTATEDSGVYITGNGVNIPMLEADTREILALPDAITGEWFYQKFDPDSASFISVGHMTINFGGTYSYTDFVTDKTETGTVTADVERHIDGSYHIWYSFFNEKGEAWFGCYGSEDDSPVLSNGGNECLRADDSVPAGREVTVGAIAGRWRYMPDNGKTKGFVTINEDGSFFCEQDLVSFGGKAVLTFDEHPDGSVDPIFTFTKNDGEEWFTCTADSELKVLSIGQDGKASMERDKEVRRASANEIAGTWDLKPAVNPSAGTPAYKGKVQVYEGNWFTLYDPETDEQMTGSVYAGYDSHPDGSVEIYYMFFDKDGQAWLGFPESKKEGSSVLRSGNAGDYVLTREEAEPNSFGYYDVTSAAAAGISIGALDGEWNQDNATLYFYDGGAFKGKFRLYSEDEGEMASGDVKLQYTLDEEGARIYRYVLYSGGYVYLEFEITGEIPLNKLTAPDGMPAEFTRSEQPDSNGFYTPGVCAGGLSTQTLGSGWKQQDTEADTRLSFDNCDGFNGQFHLTSSLAGEEDTAVDGTVKLQYSYNEEGVREYYYVCYVAGDDGKYDQIYMQLNAENNADKTELSFPNNDHIFARETVATAKYTGEQLCDMAKKDYEDWAGVLPAASEVQDSKDGKVTIVMKDADGKALDSYTVDPDTGIGERASDSSEVDLPQTGNNSLRNLLLAIASFLLTCLGIAAVEKSGFMRRRRDDK